jgi:hypothetical protein
LSGVWYDKGGIAPSRSGAATGQCGRLKKNSAPYTLAKWLKWLKDFFYWVCNFLFVGGRR